MAMPVLDYATPQAPQKRRMSTTGILLLWSCIATFLLVACGDGAQVTTQSDYILGFAFAVVLTLALVLTTVVIPRLLNRRARSLVPDTRDEFLPVPRGFRILLKTILGVALVIATGVQQCPHGTFLTFSTTWITLQGGPPCRNGPRPTSAVFWVITRLAAR